MQRVQAQVVYFTVSGGCITYDIKLTVSMRRANDLFLTDSSRVELPD